MKRVCALYYKVLQYQLENLARLRECLDLLVLPDPDSDTPEYLQDIEVIFAPLGFYWGRKKIDLAPRLKVIASNTSTTIHINEAYAHQKGVAVISLVGEVEFLRSITATAEHTWGLLLALMRRTPWAFAAVCDGRWNRRPFGARAMLSSLDLGIVGLGRLGQMVAEYGRAFRMTVRYYDPYVPTSPVDGVERVKSLTDLVAQSDVISIHVPRNPETEGMFNRSVFECIRSGAYLINTARGELMDVDALLESLKNGRLAGAALDVFPGEYAKGFTTVLTDHPLIEYARCHDNLLITPHIGGSTIDAWRLTEAHTIDLVLKHLGLVA